jgi:hypothetical protein
MQQQVNEGAASHAAMGCYLPLAAIPAIMGSRLAAYEQKHYTVQQLSVLWCLSDTKVRTLFEHEPDVVHIGESSRRVGRKLVRGYGTLRIPEHVAARVYKRLCAKN